MKNIEFTDSEIAELRNFYQQQLEKTLEKLETIKGILNKIDTDEKETEETQVTSKPPDTLEIDEKERTEPITPRPSDTLKIDKVEQIEPKKRKKKVIKSKWGKFILDLLKQHDRPVKFDDIVEEAIYKFKIPEDKYKNVRQAITNSSFILRIRHKKTRNFKLIGEKGKYCGLTRWFDKNGELNEKYKKERIPTLTEKDTTQKEIDKKTTAKKPTWVPFVLNTIKENDKLLKSNTLTNIAIEKYKINESDYEKTRMNVASALSKQERESKKLKTYSKAGIKGKYYGLSEWFVNNEELARHL